MSRPIRNVIGFDDGPFPRKHRGEVLVIGAVYTNTRLDGIVSSQIERDGAGSTDVLAQLVLGSRFNPRLIMLQGIALGGFNVVDIHGLHERTGFPVLVMARKQPDLERIERVLRQQVPDGATKWGLIEKAGPMEPLEEVWVQRAGLSLTEARRALRDFTLHGKVPEPLRVAHLIAGGVATGHSRGSA